jgi:hypothetical protein
MKRYHAAALTLVGWYLMFPPTQEMLDSACEAPHRGILGDLKALSRGSPGDNAVTCDLESLQLDERAPISKWESGRAFETLADCEAERNKPATDHEKRSWEYFAGVVLEDDRKIQPTPARALPNDFVKMYMQTRQTARQLSRCIASDDPRLAK